MRQNVEYRLAQSFRSRPNGARRRRLQRPAAQPSADDAHRLTAPRRSRSAGRRLAARCAARRASGRTFAKWLGALAFPPAVARRALALRAFAKRFRILARTRAATGRPFAKRFGGVALAFAVPTPLVAFAARAFAIARAGAAWRALAERFRVVLRTRASTRRALAK